MTTLIGQKKGRQIEVTTDGERLIYNATREYIVYDQTGTAGEGDILGTSGIPLVNAFYFFDGIPAPLLCKSKSAEQFENNNKYWTVSADFNNEPQDNQSDTGGNEQDSGNPLTWYSIVNFDFETYESPINAVNFAGRPYSPPITIKRKIPVIKFTQYMQADLTIYDLIKDYDNVLNLNEFLGGFPGTWLLNIAGASFGVTNGVRCWKVNFELRWAPRSEFNVAEQGEAPSVRFVSYWDVIVPQLDTVDIRSTPFSFLFENRGDVGKLDSDGDFFINAEDPVIYKQETSTKRVDFSFIRIRDVQ